MATTLEPGKSLKRLIKIHGIEGMVEVTLSHEGMAMRIPGTKKHVSCMWTDVAKAMYTPNEVPAWLHGEPLKFLAHEAEKVIKNRAKRESKQ